MKVALVLVLAGCAGRVVPPNNAERPIQIELRVDGWRAEEVRDRLERILVRDPEIGLGRHTVVTAFVERRLCAVSFQIPLHVRDEPVTFAYWVPARIRDEDDFDECLRRVLPGAAEVLAERLHLPRYRVTR